MTSTLKLLFLSFAFALASASKCPEARKPHVTSCSIFYECINLPESGYVWAPSKCPEGLVFQPYLRLCVLPGDTWTCIEPSSPPFPPDLTSPNTPELLDTTKTSYHGLNLTPAPSMPNFNENLENLHPIMPHPLIEIGPNKPQPGKNSPTAATSKNDKISKFHELSRVFFYQNVEPSRQIFLTSPIIDASSNEYFIQLIHNYIINKTVNARINKQTTRNYPSNYATESAVASGIEATFGATSGTVTSETASNPTATAEIPLDDELTDASNIVAIKGNLGQKEYVTIEKYKLLSSQVHIELIEFIPCTTGIRLSNTTNCMKYYTCDPTKPEVHDFTCPAHTAFNAQINLCDPQKFKSCAKKLGVLKSRTNESITNEERNSSENPCDKTGKFGDKSSDKFYYLCYTNGNEENLSYIRLSCPNDLIFCEERKVCTSRRFCSHSDLR